MIESTSRTTRAATSGSRNTGDDNAYRLIGVPTPYLWSFSNLYIKGKFLKDHVFDPEEASKQVGAGLVPRTLVNKG